jgi:hypothetical protein
MASKMLFGCSCVEPGLLFIIVLNRLKKPLRSIVGLIVVGADVLAPGLAAAVPGLATVIMIGFSCCCWLV